jgi:hypothetical protein
MFSDSSGNTSHKCIEIAFVGHGEILPDSADTFTLPENCCLITYSPDNYNLTNSAIQLIAQCRADAAFNTPEDIRRFAIEVGDQLDNGEVKVYEPGSVIVPHILYQLKDRDAVGTEEHKEQYKGSIQLLKEQKVYVQDAESSAGKYSRTYGEAISKKRISLEKAIKPRAEEADRHHKTLVIHWLCCRRDKTHRHATGKTQCRRFSRTYHPYSRYV